MIDTMMCHDPMEKKRQEHIKELIMTEQGYIEDMRLVHEVFFFQIFFFLCRCIVTIYYTSSSCRIIVHMCVYIYKT